MTSRLARCLNLRFVLIGALAGQYVVFQLLTGVQYWDSPRNLHWGIVAQELPRFIIDAENPYDRVNGFPPDPASLAPAGLAREHSGPLHPWWGPLYLIVFGLVWRLSGSYALLQSVVPVAAGIVVILTYAFGVRFIGQRGGVLAAALLALFPVFREHGPLSFVEPLSALLLMGALWAFLEQRTWMAALCGTLAMYGKIDLAFLYPGVAGLTWLLRLRSEQPLPARHVLPAIGVPMLALAPWIILIYGVLGRSTTVGGGAQIDIFVMLVPQMMEQMFMLPLSLAMVIFLFLLAPALLAILRDSAGMATTMLGIWMALGLVVLLVYSAMPGASNNPRIFIPALPALCILTAAGVMQSGRRVRLIVLTVIFAVFVIVNGVGMMYQVLQAQVTSAAMPVWSVLRTAPPGVILTDQYWQAALYTYQPVTWFEHDPLFQRNIMHDATHFRRYLAQTPIRYIVLPRDPDAEAKRLASSTVRLYTALPIGRDLGWSAEPLASYDVRAYLDETYRKQVIGEYVVYVVER
ncbi:MAG: ArnT family glycosyltransferase [Roseiflexus sp.]